MGKLPSLQQDLRYFEPRTVADLKEAVEAALEAADHLRLRSVEQPLSLLGWQYVLEGSTLGAVVLRPLIARAFLLSGEEGMAYVHNYGSAVHVRWAQYQQRMNALRLTGGFPLRLFSERTGLPLQHIEKSALAARRDGLLEADAETLRPTLQGQRFLNRLIGMFL